MSLIPSRSLFSDDRTWTLVSAGAAALAAVAVRSATHAGWRKAKGEEPPQNPVSSDTSWPTALLWTAVVALAAGLARLLALRGTAAGWKKVTGHSAPVD